MKFAYRGWTDRHEQQATKVVTALVSASRDALFEHFPDIGVDDLIQELLLDVRASFRTFDASRQGGRIFESWCHMVAQRRMLNRLRDRAKRAKWEREAASQRQYAHSGVPWDRREADGRGRRGEADRRTPVYYPDEVIDPPDRPEGDGEVFEGAVITWDGQESAAAWLHTVYVRARILTNKPEYRARRTYEMAQMLAVAALGRKLNESVRGLRGLFEDREDLRRVLGFDLANLPSREWFRRALFPDVSLSVSKN